MHKPGAVRLRQPKPGELVFSPHQLAALESKFRKCTVNADTPETHIKWSAAQQEVLEFIRGHTYG